MDKMLVQIERDHVQALFCLCQRNKTAVFDFQILPGIFGQPHRDVLQMFIDLLACDLLRNHTTFVHDGHCDFIIDSILQGVFVNQGAKLGIGVLCRNNLPTRILRLLLDQWCASKGNLDSIREHLVHIEIEFSILRSVSLIDEQKQILAIIAVFLLDCCFKLVHQCCNDRIAVVLQKFDQPLAGFGSVGTHLGMDKVISNLFIQIDTIRDHNKPRFPDLAFWFHALPGDHLCQHNHRDSFAAALRMPDNTVSGVRIVSQQNAIHALFNRKILLISTDLFHIVIVDDKVVDQVQQPLRMQQRYQRTVLFPDLSIR